MNQPGGDRPSPSGLDRIGPGQDAAVALSGGVDSALAAWILKQGGRRVVGVHLVLNPNPAARQAAAAIARSLELDFEVLDLSADFEEFVVEPFVRAYARGRTPSPCVACNPAIKFGRLGREVARRGIPWLATGHYAGLRFGSGGRAVGLTRPKDPNKDQTYFLSRLTGETLSGVVFPLAGFTKDEIRARAAKLKLKPGPESMEACFFGGADYREFLMSRLDPSAWSEGEFVDSGGKVVGRHRGLIHYTVGQRRGLGLPGPEPFYVLRLDPAANQVIIGVQSETLCRTFTASDPVWSDGSPGPDFECLVQIRSRHRPAPARVRTRDDGRLQVEFETPQPAVAAGQAAAFYHRRNLLGGAWIDPPQE